MPGIEVGVACSGGATRSGGSAAEENGGGGAPVSSGRGEGVGELREVEAQLMEGSARAEEGCSGGFTAAAFWSRGLRKWRKNEGNELRGFL